MEQKSVTREDHLHRLLADVVVAANRMGERWAEADDGVKKQLWRELFVAISAAEDEVYPL